MILPIVLAAALLPAILLLLYIYKKDPHPEPTTWLVKATLYGILVSVPLTFCELAVQYILFGGGEPTSFIGSTAEAFLVAAVPEESFKLLALWLILRRNPYFDEHFDGIVYAVCVGLGFAALENVVYLVGSLDNWQVVALGRAFLAVPGHYAFAVLMGYYYSVYHFYDHSTSAALKVLLMPVLAHGVYDMLALSGQISPEIGALSFFILIFFCFKMQKLANQKIIAHVEKDSGKNTRT